VLLLQLSHNTGHCAAVLNQEAVKYTKRVLKMGDRSSFPMKGDTVECYYTGKLDSGKVFDTNVDDGL